MVIPFLVEHITQDNPEEPGRPLRWVTPAEAKVLLRLNREQPFTNEHDRVIDRAFELVHRR